LSDLVMIFVLVKTRRILLLSLELTSALTKRVSFETPIFLLLSF
jgi:hypothetical protein